MEIVERFLSSGYEVHISSPGGKRIEELVRLGAIHHEIIINRHGLNPVSEAAIVKEYIGLMKTVHPAVIFSFTIKPNIYGGMAAGKLGIPFVANITGLGTAIENGGAKRILSSFLYRIGLRKAQKVFFQNHANKEYMVAKHIVRDSWEVIPGAGVNLAYFGYEPYPRAEHPFILSVIGRLMRDKGTYDLIEAARKIRSERDDVVFRLIGFFDDDCKETVKQAVEDGVVIYIEQQMDVRPYISESHAVIQPSHHEGLSNVLLEAAAMGRPVLSSNISGCKEAFDDGKSGIGFEADNPQDLYQKIKRFLLLSVEEREEMGVQGRKKMEREFDRKRIVEKYSAELMKVVKEKSGKGTGRFENLDNR